jgi:hypothetical protein
VNPVSTDPHVEPRPLDVPDDGSLTVLRVHPMVWKRALAAADGDARRIEIIDETNVKVHNRRVR